MAVNIKGHGPIVFATRIAEAAQMNRRLSQPGDMLFTRLAEKLLVKLLWYVRFNIGVYVAKLSPKAHVDAVEFARVVLLGKGLDAF